MGLAGRRFLVISEAASTRRFVRRTLAEAGAPIEALEDLGSGLDAVARSDPAAVILDVDMAEIDAGAALTRLRTLYTGAVLAIAGEASARTTIDMLDLGADDCMTGPMDEGELRARFKAARHKSLARSGTPRLLQLGDLEIDLVRWEIRRGHAVAVLSPAEFAVLAQLAQARGAVVKTSCLKLAVQDGSEDGARLRTSISTLRRKLGQDGAGRVRIWAERGLGYRLEISAGAGVRGLEAF